MYFTIFFSGSQRIKKSTGLKKINSQYRLRGPNNVTKKLKSL